MLAPTHAVVHAERLRANARAVRQAVGRPVLAAVKADGYGHGAVEVAHALAPVVDWFGVATVPEALQLRHAGVRNEILKLSHVLTPQGAQACVDADVVTACVGLHDARLLADTYGTARVHLKVDTGMGRIGVRAQEAAQVAAQVEALGGVRVEGVFTHMPVSDDPAQDRFSREQVAVFRRTADAVQARLGRELVVHMANSGGVLGHEDAWCSLVRPGIMLYGYYPDAATPRTVLVEPALEWFSRVSFVKCVEAGESVGYGRTWTADEPTYVATVPIGYADGYPRLLSNRGHVLIGGRARPVVGRVCMDQVMVAVDEGTRLGDEVALIGRQGDAVVTADDIAGWAGTISYEVLCGIGKRVPRLERV